MQIKEAAQWLRERDHFLILTHKRPDGDTLCSAAALARGLQNMGKTAWLLPNPEATERYKQYMESYFAPEGYSWRHVLSVDTASENMFQINGTDFTDKTGLSIDHHMSNSHYAEHTLVMPEAAACGEIIYLLLMELCGSIDKETANQLYIALTTDTGCFCYANTNTQTLEIGAKLIAAGAENARLSKALFRTKERSRILLEGKVMDGIRFFREDTIAVATVTQQIIRETGATEETMDDIASIPGQIAGVEAGVTIKELPDGTSKISLRTVRHVNASEVCARFGGGGHKLAAGCSMKCSPKEAAERMAEAITEIWTDKL